VEYDLFRRGVAEFVGAFTLIFIGGGAGIVTGQDIVAVALANGLAIGIMVSNLGHISGGHFNPAITLGFVATRRIALPIAIVYWISQFAGAIVAAAILRGLFTHAQFLGAVPHAAEFGAGKGFVVEIILTFFLVWAVFATAVDPRGAFKSIAGLAIGLTITIDVLMGGSLTGAAMNPARAFGPELLGNFWGEGWIYYLGPATPRSTRSSAARRPSASARAATRAAACEAPPTHATRPCASTGAAARRSPCSGSRARSAAAPPARAA
jgi:MIP family channel proteins